MKELSIEEKAKRYDELKVTAQELEQDGCFDKITLFDLLPELAESEDERIRKEMIRAFKSLNTLQVWNGIERTDILAWLEKQKGTEREKEGNSLCKGEQKPVDKVEPIEGELPYNNPADTLEGEIDNIWRKLSCNNRFSSTKEGFEEVIRHFINFVWQNHAWSEEDERKISKIYSILGQAADTHAFSTTCRLIGDKECIDLQDFLKSLRPQNRWKPSEEQLRALREASVKDFDIDRDSPLYKLYQQLKAL